ncbi:BON domain-containing protein [Simplicispira hankyongi]|uniref:BON domain-containing protein n=1 Tax=Simplicispira hankyongi TaxID=2315688 RepID=A0A398C6J9_9BURK|nr:BON domain-containing protein [Simplicispira hankyongi]RID96877.1 BON domain-containing protein [Simplicispira hankyongi]
MTSSPNLRLLRRAARAGALGALLIAWLCTAKAQPAAPTASTEPRSNAFGDPFLQVTDAMPGCPMPEGPLYTAQQVRELAHVRAQHGGSCYSAGRCRLPNSYLYDADIAPRLQRYLRQDGRFNDTSVWILSQRRIVTLMGCVQTATQSESMEHAAALVDDVMGVVNLLSVGTAPQATRYPVAAQKRP